MANFALIDEYNNVVTVIVAEQHFIDSGAMGDPANWIEDTDDIWNSASAGNKWDPTNRAFIQTQTYPSWVLNDKFQWTAPVPYPEDNKRYGWNEEITNWEEIGAM